MKTPTLKQDSLADEARFFLSAVIVIWSCVVLGIKFLPAVVLS